MNLSAETSEGKKDKCRFCSLYIRLMYHSKVHVLMYLSGIADCVEYIFLLSCLELLHVHAYTIGVSWKHHKKLGMFKTSLGLRNSCCSTLVVGNLKWNKNLNKYVRIWIKDIKGTTERKDVIVKTKLHRDTWLSYIC